MNWIKENKFLTGFIAVLVIGAGGLGYLLYTAWGAYSDVTDQYNSTAGTLHQLQTRVPYPDQGNLVKYRAQRDDLIDATHNLATTLSQMELPTSDMSPSSFQDQLRQASNELTDRASKAGVKLPDTGGGNNNGGAKFAMDFDQYTKEPPPEGAAGPLGRQLSAMVIAMDILVDEHVDVITSVKRTRLSQEGAAAGGNGGGGGGGGRRGGGGGGRRGGGGNGFGGEGGGGGGGGLVETVPFDIQFTASQPAFQKVLNDFAASSKQFFITRALVIENSNATPVEKSAGNSGGSAPSQPSTTGTDTSGGGGNTYLSFIVGTEKLNVAMRIDMVSFNPPGRSARNGGQR